MQSTTVTLPSRVYERGIPGFFKALGSANKAPEVVVDFREVSFLIPIAIVALASKVRAWQRAGKTVVFVNHDTCAAAGYLKRIDFFKHCDLNLQEDFTRHDSSGRFVEIVKIGRNSGAKVDELSTRIAECLAPDLADSDDIEETGPFDFLEYGVSELVNNVNQHSCGVGYVSAQYMPSYGWVRLGVADFGIGIRKSFEQYGSPHWNASMSDLEAIARAIEPRVSCKGHLSSPWGDPVNAGVGLTLLRELAIQTGGTFIAVSGSGIQTLTESFELEDDEIFEGVACGFSFRRSKMPNFVKELEFAKVSAGLLSKPSESFDGLFK